MLRMVVRTISVPTPKGLPPNAISADSPPDEPPDVSLRLSGFTVRPNVLLTDSAYLLLAQIHLLLHDFELRSS
jgi:hypothetical protein